jgi:TPR repeat protein
MIRTALNVICRFGVFIPLFTSMLWTPMPAFADPADTSDLKQVRKLAEQGSVIDEITLAGDYFIGRGVPQDSKMAAFWYEKAASHGSPEAENQIGYFYQAGIGVPQDSGRALHWYQLSAASGFAKAKVNLGVAYLHGVGVKKDEELAVQLLTQAFQAGNSTAATYLGVIYFFGVGVKEDKVVAERWFESALKLHDPLAAFNLGSLYSVEVDHPHDIPKAAELLSQAVDAGYVPAMHSLGLLLVNHPELSKTAEQSRTLLERAASAGSWRSSAVLAILARDGRGVPVDPSAAYFHFRVAVLQGGPPANQLLKKDLDLLAAKLQTDQRRTADSAAKSWSENHSQALAFVYKQDTKKAFPVAAIAVAPEGSYAGELLPLASFTTI